ncbi:MAG: hypothetical protein ACR2PZ_22605 [Pseudomonadales bacterium]
MSVDTFDPSALPQSLTEADLAVLLRAAEDLEATQFGLSDHEVARLGRLVRQDGADWQLASKDLSNVDLIALIRLLVLAEGQLSGWESGAKSPVIVLAGRLKDAKAYPAELTAWIKANSENRFLPYGSLLDRL